MKKEELVKLLSRCLKRNPDSSVTAQLEQLSDSDWSELIQQTCRHGVASLCYRQFKSSRFKEYVPAKYIQELRTIYRDIAWNNTNIYYDIGKLLNVLQREGIPVILLKGAHLAQIVYGNIALRPMGDIDILVKKSDLLKAKEHLLGLGYSPLRETDITTTCTVCQHLPPMAKQDSSPVELHWTLEAPTTPFTIDIEGLWRRAQTVSIAGADALTLSPEDLLLHLCLHTSAHHLYSNGLRAFCDIRETIRYYRNELNWEIVQNRAREWGAGNAVYLTLHLAESLLGADVPEEFLNKLKPEKETPHPLAAAEQFVFNDSAVARRLPVNQQTRRLFASKSALKTATLFLQRIFLPRQTMARLYDLPPDSPRILLYYPVRLKDLLIRHNRTVWKIWCRDKATVQQFELVEWLSY